jgi:hypothetical protein
MPDRQAKAAARLHESIRRRAASDIELMMMRIAVRVVAVLCLAAWLADRIDRR